MTILKVIQNGDDNSLNIAETPGMRPANTPSTDGNHRLLAAPSFIWSLIVC
jgi:hypothetical protein